MSSFVSVRDVDMIYEAFRQRIIEVYTLSGVSTDNMVLHSCMSAERINSIVNGTAREITLREVAGLSIALNVSVERLLASSD
jgi:hypothetical protein